MFEQYFVRQQYFSCLELIPRILEAVEAGRVNSPVATDDIGRVNEA